MTNSADCTFAKCSRDVLASSPSLAGNAVLLALFALLIPLTVGLGYRYRSLVIVSLICTGLVLEVLGYIGRILLHMSPLDNGSFTLFLIGTILGANFIAVAAFLVMPRIVALYGEQFRSWRPTWYSVLFFVLVAISLILELVGAIMAGLPNSPNTVDTGVQILAGGVAILLISLGIFAAHAMFFAISVRTNHNDLDPKFCRIYADSQYKAFLASFTLSIFLLVLRTAFRLVAVAEGVDSTVAQDETLLVILDGVVVFLATLLLLVFFPPRIFGTAWAETSGQNLTRRTMVRPNRPEPVQLLSPAQQSPHYRSSIRPSKKSPEFSPRYSPGYSPAYEPTYSPHHSPRNAIPPPPPPPPGNMVDDEALW